MRVAQRAFHGFGLFAEACLVVVAVGGCPARSPGVVTAGELPVDQITRGAAVFSERCAGCHGPTGRGNEETAVPPIVGADALPHHPPEDAKLRRATFSTAADVFLFVHVNMPLDRPGSLPMDDHWAVLAFALHASGIDLGGEPLTVERAAGVDLRP